MDNKYKTTRLSKTQKPTSDNNKTFQETLDDDAINNLLKNYKEIDNSELYKIPLNTHLRYYVTNVLPNGNINKVFRMGGILTNKDNADSYVVLSNGKMSWSAQVNKSQFFRKKQQEEIENEYEEKISDLQNENEDIKKKLDKFRKEIKRLRELLKNNNIKY